MMFLVSLPKVNMRGLALGCLLASFGIEASPWSSANDVLARTVSLNPTQLAPGSPTLVQLGPNQFLEGREDDSTGQRRFLGIPFALPPVDELRWKAPAPPDESWEGTADASRFGNSCVQSSSGFTIGGDVSEDCLYLNVYTPPKETSVNLPVLVFFYGGSWTGGSSSCPLYYGKNLVALGGEDAILVTMNYRLNVFGFMGGEALRDFDRGAGGTTGNWGLLDQRESLRWVQKHAASFGGDPAKVTIFGESAGAGSVAAHLVSQNSFGAVSPDTGNPLFTKAMMESGNPFTPWNSHDRQGTWAALLRAVRCPWTARAWPASGTRPPTSSLGPGAGSAVRS
mmetsp:Transcript_68195/g.137189  ORF Transcript_68195/g.137189 Transcript_68195/m.137189 type:complete len:339 (+) Transcript_68195:57-1073(+)